MVCIPTYYYLYSILFILNYSSDITITDITNITLLLHNLFYKISLHFQFGLHRHPAGYHSPYFTIV